MSEVPPGTEDSVEQCVRREPSACHYVVRRTDDAVVGGMDSDYLARSHGEGHATINQAMDGSENDVLYLSYNLLSRTRKANQNI